jgi:hypothetical protein
MKLILLAFLVLIVCPLSGNSQVQIDWQTTKICDTCKPSIAYSTTYNNLIVYTEPLHNQFAGSQLNSDRRTYDSGKTWAVFRDSVGWGTTDVIRDVYFPLSAAIYFQKIRTTFAYTLDSGKSWRGLPSYPLPFAFRMRDAEKGLGVIYNTVDGENVIELRETLDSGRYWYENVGVSYTSPLRPARGNVLSDSEVIVLLQPKKLDGPSSMIKTSDRGATWSEVFRSNAGDSILPLFVSTVANTDALLLETYGKRALFISFDRGSSWQPLQEDLDMAAARTRLSVNPGQPLLLWAATAADHVGAPENLFEPNSFEHIYPSHIKLSLDTGRTWMKQDFYPPGLDSVQIFDIIPDGDKLYVVSYLDSTTYVSTATISGFGSVKNAEATTPMINLYPNPSIGHATLSLDDSRIHVTSFVVVDALGSRRATGLVEEEGRLDLDPSILTDGAYTVLLYERGNLVAQSKLIVQ